MSSNDLHVLENEVIELSRSNPRFKENISLIKPKDVRHFKELIGLSQHLPKVVVNKTNFLSPSHLEDASEPIRSSQIKKNCKRICFW